MKLPYDPNPRKRVLNVRWNSPASITKSSNATFISKNGFVDWETNFSAVFNVRQSLRKHSQNYCTRKPKDI